MSDKKTNKTTPKHDWTPKPPRLGVIHVNLPKEERGKKEDLRSPEEQLSEAVNLCLALQVDIPVQENLTVREVHPKTLLRGGQVEALQTLAEQNELDAYMINTTLTPSQQRNLEQALNVKVLDRTGVILDIFAQRANTKAARLQVELAQVLYQQSRLVRAWTHLERQRGGLGKTGGPGERQIELDRRQLQERADKLKNQIKTVARTRSLQRAKRQKNTMPQVALVGYTNAGKSTLFEALTGQNAGAQDQLFATLDPLARKLDLPNGQSTVLLDTVGFIADLPTELVAAFQSTLEEVSAADAIIQVHDAHSMAAIAQAKDVAAVLRQINAQDVPTLHVWNKADAGVLEENEQDLPEGQKLSALSGEGVEELKQALANLLSRQNVDVCFEIPFQQAAALAWLHAHSQVQNTEETETAHRIIVKITPHMVFKFAKQFNW